MRAAILVLPLLALAASIATGSPGNEFGNDFLDNLAVDDMRLMELENAADAVAMTADSENSTTFNSVFPNWFSDGTWTMTGEDETGSIWYVEQGRSKFRVSPRRVLIRVDHSADTSTQYSWTERTALIDCRRHIYRILRTTHEDREGRRSESDERSGGRFVDVIPGSIFQSVEQLACDPALTSDDMSMNAVMANVM